MVISSFRMPPFRKTTERVRHEFGFSFNVLILVFVDVFNLNMQKTGIFLSETFRDRDESSTISVDNLVNKVLRKLDFSELSGIQLKLGIDYAFPKKIFYFNKLAFAFKSQAFAKQIY
jgi:hypothetical protein